MTDIGRHTVVAVKELGPLTPLILHGTRDYVEGAIFALQLLGHERFTPRLVGEKKEVGV